MQGPSITTFLGCLNPSASIEEVSASHLNLLPFNLKFQGKAPISTYFQPQEAGSSTYASFRGRRVYANAVKLPEGYTGYLVTGPAKPSATDVDVGPRTLRGEGKLLTPAPSFAAQVQEEEGGPRRSPRKSRAVAPILARPLPSKLPGRRAPAATKRKFKLDSDSEDGSDEEEAPVERPVLPTRTPRAVPEKVEVEVEEEEEVKDEVEVTAPAAAKPHSLRTEETAEGDREKETASTVIERHLVPTQLFKAFQLWTPDAPWEGGAAASGTADEFVKGLGEWRQLDAEVNAPVDWALYDEPVIE